MDVHGCGSQERTRKGCTISLPRPLQGKHRFSNRMQLYVSVHTFLSSRRWAEAPKECETAGVTWLELFILFDTTGARLHDAEHVKNQDALNRAQNRLRLKQASSM